MFKYNMLLALRNLSRRKSIAFIHISGLTIGIAVFWIIIQYVSFEKNYDQFHSKADRIYRIAIDFYRNGELVDKDAMNYPTTGPALVNEFPEITSFVRITPEYGKIIFRRGEVLNEETKVFYADSSMFNLFDYPFIEGVAEDALKGNNKLVLTLSLAEKYFGPRNSWQESPIGQFINFNNDMNLIVSGIVKDSPQTTHLKFNALISFDTFENSSGDLSNVWSWNDFYTYVLATPGTTRQTLQSKMEAFVDRHKEKGHDQVFIVQRMTDIHLHSHQSDEAESGGDADMVNALIIIAFVILIIAWINYINLSTARGEERAKEVGIRKVTGASRGSLIYQFLGEALLVNILSIACSLLIAYFALPYLGLVLAKQLSFALLEQPIFWLALVALAFIGTLLSGSYPAFVLSSYNPSDVLKGSSQKLRSKDLLRKGLITFQFATAIILIIGTLVIYQQVNYMQNKPLGFDLNRKVIINAPGVYNNDSIYQEKYLLFKNKLKQIPVISHTTLSSAIPGGNLEYEVSVSGRSLEGMPQPESTFWIYNVDDEFIDGYNLKVLAGRKFSSSKSDEGKSVINRTAAILLGFNNAADIVGKKFRSNKSEIIGVVEDYHHQSVKSAFLPMVMVNDTRDMLYYTVNLKPSVKKNLKTALDDIRAIWTETYPENPFSYFFLEDRYNYQYQADLQIGKVFSGFSLFAVLITCLGLFGLSSYMVITRTKEIGIRKVLGASTGQIISILSKDYLILLALSTFLAVPIGYYIFSRWLEGFAWRIDFSLWLFSVPIILVSITSLIAVSGISFKAANANPVDSLRNE